MPMVWVCWVQDQGTYVSSHAISQWWLPKILLPAGTSFVLCCVFLEAQRIVCVGKMSQVINIF